MPSPFSNEIPGTLLPGPAAPVLMKIEQKAGNTARATVTLPKLAEDGSPLTGLSKVDVFYKTTSMIGSTPAAEKAAGTPYVSVPVSLEQAGQDVEVDIPGLAYGVEYFFDADVA